MDENIQTRPQTSKEGSISISSQAWMGEKHLGGIYECNTNIKLKQKLK
jgi:hypothetical protein